MRQYPGSQRRGLWLPGGEPTARLFHDGQPSRTAIAAATHSASVLSKLVETLIGVNGIIAGLELKPECAVLIRRNHERSRTVSRLSLRRATVYQNTFTASDPRIFFPDYQ